MQRPAIVERFLRWADAPWSSSPRLGLGLIVASCLVVALLAGVVANRLGDFYPSWSLAWSDLGTALL